MSITQKLARKEILKMKAYSSARSQIPMGENMQTIWLNANENPFNLQGADDHENVNRYPDPQPQKLVELFSQLYQTDGENILITRGSDEGIDCLIRLFCRAYEDNIIISSPTFGMYKIYAQTQGANIIDIPLKDDLNLDYATIIETAKKNHTKIVFLTNPHAPLGHALDEDEIENLCLSLQDDSIVVVDEAYIEFSSLPSMIALLNKYSNMVILRTMSKAFAMAGCRLGTVIASEEIIKLLSVVQSPYPLATGSINTAIHALSAESLASMRSHVQIINHEKDLLLSALKNIDYIDKIYQSDTNFIMITSKVAPELILWTKNHDIILRDFTSQIPDAIRISIGTHEQNHSLIEVLTSFVPTHQD